MKKEGFLLLAMLSILGLFVGPLSAHAETIFRPGPGLNDGTDNGSINAGKDALVSGSTPTLNYGSSSSVTGTPRSTCNPAMGKAYIQFDLSTLPADVQQVFLGVTHFSHTVSCFSNCKADFYFYPVSAPWNEMILTNDSAPAEGAAVYGPINITFPNDYGAREYDITGIYRNWKNGSVPNYGLAIYSPTVGCNNAAVMFNVHSSDDPDENLRPYLKIAPSAATTFQAPQNLRYTLNGNMLTIQWDAAAGATGYKVGLGVGSKSNWADYNVGNITQIGPIDMSGLPGTYYLAVKAYNSTQQSGYSNEIAVTISAATALAAPKNLRHTLSGQKVTILWDEAAGAGGYKLAFGSTPGNYVGVVDVGSPTQLGPIDAGTLPPGTYYLVVKAYKDSKESGYSNEIAVVLTGRAGDLSISPSSDPLAVSGTYKVNGTTRTVQFGATAQGNGKATAYYRYSDGSGEVNIDLQGPDKGTITWKGVTVDGYGSVNAQERAAIDGFSSGDLGTALATAPLDLSCAAKEKDPAALAALLMPWQMVLKYSIPGRAEKMQELSRGSACSYYGNILGSKPTSAAVLLSNEDAVPYVYGFFPFDGEDAVETSSPSTQLLTAAGLAVVEGKLFGPCGSRCRGACGADCPDTCTVKTEDTCIKDDQGKNTGEVTQYLVYECGGHSGCEWHDNCFEECLTTYGCGTWGASNCMHNLYNGCDLTAGHLFGKLNAITWAQGGPPWDKMLVFKYAQATGSDPLFCSNEKALFQRLRFKYQLVYVNGTAKGTCGGTIDSSHYDTPQTFELTWLGLTFSGKAPLEYGEISGTSRVGGSLSPDMKTLLSFSYTDTYSYPDHQTGSTQVSVVELPLSSSSDNPKSLTFMTAFDAELKKYIKIAEIDDQGCYYNVIDYNTQYPMIIQVNFAGQ